MDHFARLGLPAALDLEPATLDRAYFALQRQWHPDRFANRSAEERARASTEAAALNDAYRTLKDPLSRAVYFSSMKGVELPGDGKTIDDPDLLMEAMEA
ncbi:MAG TPA: Fe-S protein assembly co-chaperone HscB, partial [Reyranella sp.]|nr:Fe-S protein assembly co-chaperone HscB [Reyranella sp.]